jgi:hypothetical protein
MCFEFFGMIETSLLEYSMRQLRLIFSALLMAFAFVFPAHAQSNDPEYRRCELGTKQLDLDTTGKYIKPPANASYTEQAKLIMALIKAELSHIDQNCQGWSGYQEYRNQRTAQYDQTLANCRALNGDPSVCKPLFEFKAARVNLDGSIATPANFGGNSASLTLSTSTQPQVATTPVTLTPQDQRLTQYISAIKARTPSLLAGLSSTQDYLQRKWIVNRTLSAMEQMSPGAAATKYSTGFTEVKKLWNQSRDACKNVTDGELEACTNGAYFGSPEDRAAIERAPNTTQSYKPDPKLKLVPVDNVNRCLTVDMKSLFGGFTNSCNFSVMYVYCLENPDKGAWSEAFRCAEGARGIRALGTVSPNKTDVAHTHRGRVIFFACAWQTKPGAGPYGIWGQTTYSEGVGTPGIIRGTCGEQIYAP